MQYTRTLRTFSFLLLLLSAALAKEEQLRHEQKSDEGVSSPEKSAGVAEGTVEVEEAADEVGSCDASDCAELGTNTEPDGPLKPPEPEAVFDASSLDGLVADATGRTESEDLQPKEHPSPGQTRLPTLQTTEPPPVPHGAEATTDTLQDEPKAAEKPADVESTTPEDDVSVKPSTAASESRAEAPAVGDELQAAQTDGPGPLYPTPHSPEPPVPRQERTDAVTDADEEGSPSRTEERESEVKYSQDETSPYSDKSKPSGPTEEPRKELEATESKVTADRSEPSIPADESNTQSLTGELRSTVTGVGTPTETPEAVPEPGSPPQQIGESPTPAPVGEPTSEESEEEESLPGLENTAEFESEQQPSLDDPDTPQEEATSRGDGGATRTPRRGFPQEPVRVGLPGPKDEGESEGEDEDERVEGEDDFEPFEQMRAPTVAYIPELSPKTLAPTRLKNVSWFIMFYAPWCSYSQAAQPVFMEVIQYIVDHNMTVYAGKSDVSKHAELLKQFKIKSTPTFLFYRNGIRYEFDDEMSFENLKNFMNSILAAEVTRVNTTQQLSELRRAHPVIFLLVHDWEVDRDWHGTYTKVAMEKALRGKFCYTTEPGIVEDFGVSRPPAVVVIKDDKAYRFPESLSSYGLSQWINKERHVSFPAVNITTLRQFIKSIGGRRMAVLAVHEDPAQRRIAQKKAIEVVKKVAVSRKLNHLFQFVLLESVEMAERMQQGSVELPALFAYEMHTGYYFPYEPGEGEKGMTEDSIIKFFKAVSKSKIKHKGGPSYTNTFKMWWWWFYGMFHTTVTHHPTVSAVALFSIVGVVLFYLTICCRRSQKKIRRPQKGRRLQASSKQRPRQNSVNSSGLARKRKHEEMDEGPEASGSESQSHSEAESPKDK